MKNFTIIYPITIPVIIPITIEIGTFINFITDNPPPFSKPKKEVNNTITKTSSTEAPAIINCGILFPVPLFSSINFNILGTTTAGDTAAITLPIIAASSTVIPKSFGAIRTVPVISNSAGKKHIRKAGLPALFKSSISIAKPALVSIITKASCLRFEDIESIESSKRFRANGPNITPVIIIPKRAGSFNFVNNVPNIKPVKNISAKLVNIFSSS